MPQADFREKQISKLQAAIAKVRLQAEQKQGAVRAGYSIRIIALQKKSEAAVAAAGATFLGKLDVLEKQLKALGGK